MTRVYLVDDHAMVRDGMRAVLDAAGHQVVGEAADPLNALGDLLRLTPEVVLLDLSLGERSGLELLVELQRRSLPLRCIVLTMSAQPHHAAEALRLGAAGYVLKGSSAREVLAAIDTVQQGRRHLGQGVADLALQVLTGDAASDPLTSLSPRERQIIGMVVGGQSSAAIGLALHLSPKTVDTYRSRLMTKLGVPDVTALVRWAIRVGLIDAQTR
jgi:DNA-binding NarL/FixJ family response regulator